ncbi:MULTISPECIES: hypothetical protein [unclassified Paenibacillus]|jgi:hypothetical protein|uniref:hypothetical protein n=1 Tax=unclassified Paenibacillus TaxID=185978 RepID=UPI00096E6A61|nr:hypothetical protein [Paenibacillus sp. FSL H8-0259]OMF31104.1 hypothetical protein BK132_06665 [Paenibacillus sp. FSL H8-0259]
MKLNKRLLGRLTAASLSLFVMSGCTFISDPVSQMKVPQLSADKASLMTAINSSLKPLDATLIRPANDDDSSIFTEDLDKDGIMETLVFYQTKNEAVVIHGMILEKHEDTWVKKLVFDGDGTMLDSVDLRDVTGDGKLDIVTGYSRGEEKGMVVYSYSGGELEEILTKPYTKYILDDLNEDGIADITVVYFKRNEFATITTYQYNDSFKVLDELDNLDPYFDNYYNIVSGKVAENKEGIVLDSAVDSRSAYTTIVVMENNKLRVAIPGDVRTFKDRKIVSEDIDLDGIIEIGMLEPPSGWEYFDPETIPYFNSYYKWDGKDGLTFSTQLYNDPSDRFTINFSPEWHENVTVDTKSVQDKSLKFIMLDTGETVAEVSFFSPAEWDRVKNSGWKLLGRDLDKMIGYRGELEQNTIGGENGRVKSSIERKGIDE